MVISDLSDKDIIDNLERCVSDEYDIYLKVKKNLKKCERILRQFPVDKDWNKEAERLLKTNDKPISLDFEKGLRKALISFHKETDLCGYEYTVMKSRFPHIYSDKMRKYVEMAQNAKNIKRD